MTGALGIAAATTIALIQILTFLCNGCITIGLIWSKQYRTGSNILILHLAVVDISLSLVTLLATVPSYVQDGWLADEGHCALVGGIVLLLHAVVLWTICGLNYDKFSAICVPLAYNGAVTKCKTLLWLLLCWTVVTGCVLAPALSGSVAFRPRAALCLPEFRRGTGAAFGIFYTGAMLLLPAAFIIFFNVRILIVARTQRSRIVSAIVSAVTMNARLAVPTTGTTTGLEWAQRSRSPVRATVQVLLPLLLMYVPFASAVTWESLSGLEVDVRLVFAAHVLLCLSPLHGLIYGWRSKNLRNVFKNFVRKQLYKSEMQLEIQARAPRTCLHRPSIATQLTMQLPKQLQRRLSDAFTKAPHQRRRRRRYDARHHHPLRRQASELTWAQISHQLEKSNEPSRARSTDAINGDSDCSSGSPVTDRSQTSLSGAAGLAVRALRLPAAVTASWPRPPQPQPLPCGGEHEPLTLATRQTRPPLAIPHSDEAARAARSQLTSHHPPAGRAFSARFHQDDTDSLPEWACSAREARASTSSGSSESVSRRWPPRLAGDTSSEAGGSASETTELRSTVRPARLWSGHSSASIAADSAWQTPPTTRTQIPRAYSVEPQMV